MREIVILHREFYHDPVVLQSKQKNITTEIRTTETTYYVFFLCGGYLCGSKNTATVCQ